MVTASPVAVASWDDRLSSSGTARVYHDERIFCRMRSSVRMVLAQRTEVDYRLQRVSGLDFARRGMST